MKLTEILKFHSIKWMRMGWYYLRYNRKKWKLLDGIYLPVNFKYGYSVLRFIDNGQYEQGEICIIKNTLKKEDTVLELGTGLGFISAYCAKQIGSDKVYTYEANILLKERIKILYEKNNVRPKVTFAMLGKKAGTKLFYNDPNSFLASSLEEDINKKQEVSEIPVLDLNEVVKHILPTYLMMDIEGGEYDIITTIDFQSIKKIQFELHPLILGNEKVAKIFTTLRQNYFFEDTSYKSGDNFFFQKA